MSVTKGEKRDLESYINV